MSKKWQREGLMFNNHTLCWYGIEKYTRGQEIKLVVDYEGRNKGSVEFASYEEYENWLDSVVPLETQGSSEAVSIGLIVKEITGIDLLHPRTNDRY